MPSEATIIVGNDASELVRLNAFVHQFWGENLLPEEAQPDLDLVLEEVFMNVVMHAHSDGAEHNVEVRLGWDNSILTLTVEDDGVPFNPLTIPPPDVNLPVEERQIGGLGIHLVRHLMDHLEYTREGARNRFVMKKGISPK